MAEIIVLSGHSNFNTGGVGTHLRVLSGEMTKQNINHIVLMGKSKLFRGLSLVLHKIMPERAYFHFVIQVKGLAEKLKNNLSNETKIVDCHDFAALVAAIELKKNRKLNYKIIYTVHAPFFEQYFLSKNQVSKTDLEKIKKIELKYLVLCDGFVCVDDKQKDIIENKINRKINHIVLPNAVNVEFLNTIKRNNNSEKYIIISRHLYKKCGVHVGIEAFSLANIDPNIKLIIVGMGDEYTNLLSLTRKLMLEDRVIFKGRLVYEESIQFTADALISLVPSIPLGDYVEATSLSMLEAMALGVPVIASNIGGLKQVLENSGAGFLVEPNDVDALVVQIENLVCNNIERDSVSTKAKKLIEEHYSSFSWLNKRISFYEELE